MRNSIYTNTVNNLTSNVYYDDCSSPRDDDNITEFYFETRSLKLKEIDIDNSNADSWADIEKLIKSKYGNDIALIKPVCMYKHSGISLSYKKTCQFDSGQIGFSVLLKSKIRKCFEVKNVTKAILKKAEISMDAELEIYSSWLDGDVYYVEVLDKDENLIDSCGGFYGLNDAIEFSNEILDKQAA